MRAAVVQMVSGKVLELNLIQARELITEAATEGAELVVLPENFAVFGGGQYRQVADSEAAGTGPILPFLSQISREFGIWLLAGTVPLLAPTGASATAADKVFAASTLWSPEGQLAARYDKCHLFDAAVSDGVGQYRESDTFIAGEQPVTAQLPFGLMGLSVCYDLRFPELYRGLRAQGAVALTVPAAFTYTTGKAHWEVLLRARAIENQCFVLAPNQGGEHSETRVTWGHSCIIDPWGDVLAQRREIGPGIAVADLNFEALHNLRSSMPCEQHRRF